MTGTGHGPHRIPPRIAPFLCIPPPVWGLVPFSPAILRQQKPEPRSGVFRSGIHRESGTNGTIRNRIFPDDETTEPECRHRGAFVSMSRILPVLLRSTHRVGWRSRRQIWHGDITQYVLMFQILIFREQIMARLWLNPGKTARFGLIHSRAAPRCRVGLQARFPDRGTLGRPLRGFAPLRTIPQDT
jgi:hypothetical protein